jgi:hypothetical protein
MTYFEVASILWSTLIALSLLWVTKVGALTTAR